MQPLFESPKLDRELKTLVRDNFREFCSGPQPNEFSPTEIPNQFNCIEDGRPPINNFSNENNDSRPPLNRADSSSDNEAEGKFSDDEEEKESAVKQDETDDDDDLPLSKVRLKEKPTSEKVQLPASINSSFEKYMKSKTCSTLEVFLNDLRTCTSNLDSDQETYLVDNLVTTVKESLPTIASIFPETKSDEKLLAQSLSYPLFSILKVMYQHEDKCKKCFNNIVKQVFNRLPMIGFTMLYFLKVHTKLQSRKNPNGNVPFKTSLYKTLCDYLDQTLEDQLFNDLEALEIERTSIFLWILPDIYREFQSTMVNNKDVLKLLVSCIDSKNQRDIIYSITQGKLTIFKTDGVLDCIRESLKYETFEQIFLWQLVQAHDVPIESLQVKFRESSMVQSSMVKHNHKCIFMFLFFTSFLQNILPELESSNNAEALTYMLLLLRTEEPTTELIRLLLCREAKSRGDPFVTSVLR